MKTSSLAHPKLCSNSDTAVYTRSLADIIIGVGVTFDKGSPVEIAPVSNHTHDRTSGVDVIFDKGYLPGGSAHVSDHLLQRGVYDGWS